MSASAAAGTRTRGAVALTLTSIVSVQTGSALATGLFDELGPIGTVFLRALFGALLLLALVRGAPLRSREWPHRDVVLLGLAVSGVNLFFFAALDRLPLGITVTLEFVGPLGVALLGSRHRGDVLWALLAAIGIVLLTNGAAAASTRSGSCWRSRQAPAGAPTSSRATASAPSSRASQGQRWRP
jgi:threonine/homoserine efflux transporter RhtA